MNPSGLSGRHLELLRDAKLSKIKAEVLKKHVEILYAALEALLKAIGDPDEETMDACQEGWDALVTVKPPPFVQVDYQKIPITLIVEEMLGKVARTVPDMSTMQRLIIEQIDKQEGQSPDRLDIAIGVLRAILEDDPVCETLAQAYRERSKD